MLKYTAKILLFTLIWYHLIAFQGYTQSITPNVEVFGSKNGLSQVSVNFMLQDSHGFLWIGTQDGLNLFDGRVFTRFQQDPADSTSIIHSNVKALVEDQNGNIWVGTANGVCMFDRRKGIFTNPLKYISNASFRSDQNIYGLCLDHSDTLWIKTIDALFKYNIKTREFFESYKDRLIIDNNPDQVTLPLMMDNKSNLIIGTKDGLLVKSLNEPAKKYLHSPVDMKSISDNTITALLQDKEGKIWVGTQHGLNEFDPKAETFKNFILSKQDTGSANNIISLVEGEKGTIWIGTPEVIYKYSKTTAALERMQYFYWNNNRTPLQVLSAMHMDKSSILWVGISQGLLKFDSKPKKFNLYRNNDLGFPGFSSNDIGSIMVDNDGKLWFGTWGMGLNIYDRTTQKVEIYTAGSKDLKHRISNDNVRVIFKDREQNIYIGTQEGFDIYDRKTKTFSPFCNKVNAATCSFMKNNRKYCMIEDKEGNFWIGASSGMYKYDSKYKLFKNFISITSNSKNHEIKSVYSLCEDKRGFIWIGTDNGLIRFDPVKLIHKIYSRPEHPESTSLSSNSIYSLHEDSGGTLWVGTASGLDKYIPEKEGFKVFTVNNGLPNNLIYSIVDDSHGNLWMTTNRGIVKMNTEKEKFTSFDISDGMQDYEYNIQASYKSESGEIFFGGIAGINSFYPDSIKSNKFNPDVTITSFELTTASGVIHKPVFGIEAISIPYKSRTFTIEFAMLEFTDPVNNHYKYKLSGKGDEGTWIDAGTRNYASFNNVPPGDYVFTVWGSNSDIIWAQHETTLEIKIENHWLLTRTAYTIYSLIILLVIYLYIQIRTQKLRNDNKILREKEQASIKIQKQKEELSIKNKNITDSLNYAKRIQQALMPSEKNFKKILPNSFVLHRPKDIVSGDFYWINETKDLIYVSAIDCTGHGVPGAFMSIIGFELFRKIATSPEKYDPDKVLNLLNDDFAQIFKDIEGISLKDGMDIALCIIDKRTWSLQFSGAFNPIYIIRDEKIIELKGDRFSVGLDDEDEKHQGFTSQMIQLMKNDMIYLFSDGFADQFGGPDGKKFKYRRFRHILLNIHTLPLQEQRGLLDQTLDNWRGVIEQVDDVLVIGFKPEIE